MILQKVLFSCLAASCAFGLDVKPDSLSLTVKLLPNYTKALDTITLYNNSSNRIQIDTVSIKFLDGNSTDFKRGKGCDSADWSCYNYNGWSYDVFSYGVIINSLRYSKDSLFLLQDSAGSLINYTILPHDSLQFGLRVISGCAICDQMPFFPATTNFQYSFIVTNGQRAAFHLTLHEPTHVAPVQIPHRYLPAGRLGQLYNLRGQKMTDGSLIGIFIRNNKTYFRLDWNMLKFPNWK
jgi:hypothetical protein